MHWLPCIFCTACVGHVLGEQVRMHQGKIDAPKETCHEGWKSCKRGALNSLHEAGTSVRTAGVPHTTLHALAHHEQLAAPGILSCRQ